MASGVRTVWTFSKKMSEFYITVYHRPTNNNFIISRSMLYTNQYAGNLTKSARLVAVM